MELLDTEMGTPRQEDLASQINDRVNDIQAILDRVLNDANQAVILGPEIYKRPGAGLRKPPAFVALMALWSDLLRIIERALWADDKITQSELEFIYPLIKKVTPLYSIWQTLIYRRFSSLQKPQCEDFLRIHSEDRDLFGGKTSNTFLGLGICTRVAQVTGDTGARDLYEKLMLDLFDGILAVDGPCPKGNALRDDLIHRLGIGKASQVTPPKEEEDPRIKAFCRREGAEVFHAVAHLHEIWTRDPFDVPDIHGDVRAEFDRQLNRITGDVSPKHGIVLLILGESGSGKTHLMRAFRNETHCRRLGYCGYLQMSTKADNYARYILLNLLDALDKPYDPPDVQMSGLLHLSNALAEIPGGISADKLMVLREGSLPDTELTDLINSLVDDLICLEELQQVDLDILRAFLYLQRNEPRIRIRVSKYLRCDDLTPSDRRVLGEMTPRQRAEDPIAFIDSLARVMWVTQRSGLVLLVDQLEDIFRLEDAEAYARRSLDAIRQVVDRVPSSLVVISCLEDYYTAIRKSLSAPIVDRIEKDPDMMRLSSKRTISEIESLVSRRLEYLYDAQGIRYKEDDPIFPFHRKDLEKLRNVTTRMVVSWCHEYQDRCIREGGLVECTDSVQQDGTVGTTTHQDLEQQWNDCRTGEVPHLPEADDDFAELFNWACENLKDELPATQCLRTSLDGRFVEAALENPHRSPDQFLIAICNKAAPGGGLSKQVTETTNRAGNRTPVLLRCTDYPAGPRTQVARQIGELITHGGRRVVAHESDWRTILAFKRFQTDHQDSPDFVAWKKARRPLSQTKLLRESLSLAEVPEVAVGLTSASAQVQPQPVEGGPLTEKTQANPPVPVAEEPAFKDEGPVRVGQTLGIRPEQVTVELGLFKKHAAFLGGTGSGKTTLALGILEGLLVRGIPVVMVDRKGDLCAYGDPKWWESPTPVLGFDSRKKSLRERVDVRIYTPGEPSGRPLILPVIPAGMAEMPVIEREKQAQLTASALGSMLTYKDNRSDRTKLVILAKAIEQLGSVDTKENLTLEDLVKFIDERDPGLIGAIGRLDAKPMDKLVEDLETLRLQRWMLFSGGEELLRCEALLGLPPCPQTGKTRLSIISTKFLGNNATVDFWVARLLLEISRWASKHPSGDLQAAVFFDEADMYLPAQSKPATKEPMQDLLKRARSAGVGVFLATQTPGDLDYRCRENILNWFVGRVAEKRAIEKMRPLLSQCNVDLIPKLSGQKTGEFFVLNEGSVTPIKAERSLMDTKQRSEDEILELARLSK